MQVREQLAQNHYLKLTTRSQSCNLLNVNPTL